MNWRMPLALLTLVAAAAAGLVAVRASDHDDGENDVKPRSLNLTDLYVFREGDESGNPAQNANLVFVMNSNPRSLARQQYYFSANARYEFHVTQRAGPDAPVTGLEDVLLRFEFGAPDANKQQPVTVTAVRNGVTMTAATATGGGPILTTPLNAAPVNTDITLGTSTLTVFAGLREDPFFFDVERFFRIRAFGLGTGPDPRTPPGSGPFFRDPTTAVDFTAGYNVNSIVVRVPIAFLQGSVMPAPTTFDAWETISIPN